MFQLDRCCRPRHDQLGGDVADTNALRPNIVLILADDLIYSGHHGCFGSEISGNLDRMAAGECRDENQFYTTPVLSDTGGSARRTVSATDWH